MSQVLPPSCWRVQNLTSRLTETVYQPFSKAFFHSTQLLILWIVRLNWSVIAAAHQTRTKHPGVNEFELIHPQRCNITTTACLWTTTRIRIVLSSFAVSFCVCHHTGTAVVPLVRPRSAPIWYCRWQRFRPVVGWWWLSFLVAASVGLRARGSCNPGAALGEGGGPNRRLWDKRSEKPPEMRTLNWCFFSRILALQYLSH